MIGGRPPAGREEIGQTVASFPTYEAAQKAVSALIAGEIPARDIAIVGQGLRSIERVTGRLGYATAARSGAINGLLLGLFFSAIFVLGSPSVPIQAFVGVLFVGIAIGMLMSILTYSFVRRRRDFASVMQVVADHYEVTVVNTSIHRARQILGPQAAAKQPVEPWSPPISTPPAAPPAEPTEPEPPRYGERRAADGEAADPGRAQEQPAAEPTKPEPTAPEPTDPEPPRYGERRAADAEAADPARPADGPEAHPTGPGGVGEPPTAGDSERRV